MASWSEAKRAAAAAERAIEAPLEQFLRVKVDPDQPANVSAAEEDLVAEINKQLQALASAIDRLVACPSAEKPATSHAQIKRFREVRFDRKQQFQDAQRRLQHTREGEQLRHHLQREMRQDGGNDSAASHLMSENASIRNASKVADETIQQANATYDELIAQRQIFSGTTGRLIAIGQQVPGINILIKRIQDKRTRDNTIVALVIAFCTCFMLWYWLSGWGI